MERPRNVATVAGPVGQVLCEYTKFHPFPLGPEINTFHPGDQTLLFEWGGLQVAPVICYDLRFPELFRRALQMGAECFAIIACWPTVRLSHWRALCIARAIENQAFVFACNRTGEEPGNSYSGGSLIVSPMGDVLAEGSAASQVVSAEVDPGVLRRWREQVPAWKDHRLLSP
jgi:predicted amidohydrolase